MVYLTGEEKGSILNMMIMQDCLLPFLKMRTLPTDTESEDEESIQETKENATITTEQENSAPKYSPTNLAHEENSKPTESATETSQPKEQEKPMETPKGTKKATPHNGIWVPKKTIQAQQGSTQIWVPKGC